MLVGNLTRFVLGNEFELVEMKQLSNGNVWVVRKRRKPFEVCPKCATPSTTQAGRCKATLRDEPLRSRALFIEVHKHRYFCKTCRKPFTESTSLSWPRRRTTYRFRKAVAQMCGDMTDLTRVRKRMKVSSGFIYQVYYDQIETRLRERRDSLRWPKVLGIDEHFFTRKKGYTDYVTVFTDIGKKKLFEVAEGKSTKSLLQQVAEIPGRENVKIVAIDMSSTYRALIRILFPNAKIVADKFHVLRLLSPAIIKERKLVQGGLHDAKMRRLLLRNRGRLDYFQRSEVDAFLRNHRTLDELYRAKEKLHLIFRTLGPRRAAISLKKFIADLENKTSEPLRRLARTLKAWQREIVNHFETGITNAFTEQTNNRGKLVQKRAYGYKSFRNYRLRFLSACLHEGYAS